MVISVTCKHSHTFGDLLVQSLQEDALINILDMDEVGVVGIDERFKTLKLLYRESERHGSKVSSIC